MLIFNLSSVILRLAVGIAEVPYSHTVSSLPLLLPFEGGEHQNCLWGMRKVPWFCGHADPLEKLVSHLQTSCWGGFIFPDEADNPCAPVKCSCQRSWWGAHLGTKALLCNKYLTKWSAARGLHLSWPWSCPRAFHSPSSYVFNKEDQIEQWCSFYRSSCSVKFFSLSPCEDARRRML